MAKKMVSVSSEFYTNSSDQLERKVFVIMPFASTNTRDEKELNNFYEKFIKAPLESFDDDCFKLVVARSDKGRRVTEGIVRDLVTADFVIADLSGTLPDPNVMYGLGVRLSISKSPVILIREKQSGNVPIFECNTLHTFHYETHMPRVLIEYMVNKIVMLETAQERYHSPVINKIEVGESLFHDQTVDLVKRRLKLIKKDLEFLIELYGNLGSKALEDINLTPQSFLAIIDNGGEDFSKLRSDRRYMAIDSGFANALCQPQSASLNFWKIDEEVGRMFHRKMYDQLSECIQLFNIRFIVSRTQWAMDGTLAASTQFVRSMILLSAVIESACKLVECDFNGRVGLNKGMCDGFNIYDLKFNDEYNQFTNDLNVYRRRILKFCSEDPMIEKRNGINTGNKK